MKIKASTYKELDTQVKKMETELSKERKQLEHVRNQIETAELSLNSLWETYKRLVIEDEKRGISTIEAEFDKSKRELKRNEALAEALQEKTKNLQEQYNLANDERKNLFSFLAKAWLEREIAKYDDQAGELRKTISRFLICFNFLRELGLTQTYVETVGEGYSFLPGIRLPVLKNFDQSIFLHGAKYQADKNEREKVFSEIIQ